MGRFNKHLQLLQKDAADGEAVAGSVVEHVMNKFKCY